MRPTQINHHTDDEEIYLWQQLLTGNVDAFEKLINRTYDLLFQYGNKFSRDQELVKDCIQDIFLEVWEKRQRLNNEIPPKAYLVASLRRRMHRLALRNRMTPVDDFGQLSGDFDVDFGAEYSFISTEQDQNTAMQITTLLNDLPKRQKEAVYLKFFHNLERDEIATVMDIYPQSVSNLLQAAFKLLKSQWKTVISFILMFQ